MPKILAFVLFALLCALGASYYQSVHVGYLGVFAFAMAGALVIEWVCRVLPGAIFLDEDQISKETLGIPYDEDEEPPIGPTRLSRVFGAFFAILGAGAVLVTSYGVQATTWTMLGLTIGLLAIAWLDAETKLMPDDLTGPVLWSALIFSAAGMGLVPASSAIYGAALGYGAAWLLSAAFYMLLGKNVMGTGDFMLFAIVGAALGPVALMLVWFMSSLIAVVSAFLLYSPAEREEGIPFGPHIVSVALMLLIAKPWLSPLLLEAINVLY